MKHKLTTILSLTAALLPFSLLAEEGAGGHYMPGATATFIDALPGKTALVIADAFTYYHGSASLTQPIEFGGQVTLDAHATAYADTLFGLYQTPLQLLGGNYAAGIAIPYIWLLLLFAAPFVIVAKISVSQQLQALPPYTPLIQMAEEGTIKPPGQDDTVAVQKGVFIQASLDNFAFLFDDPLYYSSYLNSLKVAAISTLFCLLLGYPIAYGIARSPPASRNALLMLIILPFWTSFLIRVYAWVGILKNNGVINNLLIWLGIIHDPIPMMNTDFAVYVGIVYS